MDIFRVSFIGHRVVDEYRQVEEELDEVIELLHRKYGFIDFNVGRNGEFDDLATQAVRRFRREWEEWCELTLVEPYPVANLDIIEKSYDSVIIPTDRKCHYKAAIGERNKWLAENCDMMIVYIKRDYGGAYKCYKYAQELGVPIMNIADNIKNKEQMLRIFATSGLFRPNKSPDYYEGTAIKALRSMPVKSTYTPTVPKNTGGNGKR